jgi:hypothetical protein
MHTGACGVHNTTHHSTVYSVSRSKMSLFFHLAKKISDKNVTVFYFLFSENVTENLTSMQTATIVIMNILYKTLFIENDTLNLLRNAYHGRAFPTLTISKYQGCVDKIS